MTTKATPKEIFNDVLLVMAWEQARIDVLQSQVKNITQLRCIDEKDLKNVCLNLKLTIGEYSELVYLRKWYAEWKADPSRSNLASDFNNDVWEDFVDLHVQQAAQPTPPPSIGAAAATTTGTTLSGVNSTFKVEAKEFPKLPKNTNLKGKVYNDWHDVVSVKLKQAQVGDLLLDTFVMPAPTDVDYDETKIKDDFLLSVIVSATLGTNAYAWVDPSKHGHEVYRTLNETFKGDDHVRHSALTAVDDFSKLSFGKNSNLSL